MYQPKTTDCNCLPGIQRDNCPDCEGTGQRIDFARIRTAKTCPECGRVFDMFNPAEAAEWLVGHDCEV